jgi:hypothetical protein
MKKLLILLIILLSGVCYANTIPEGIAVDFGVGYVTNTLAYSVYHPSTSYTYGYTEDVNASNSYPDYYGSVMFPLIKGTSALRLSFDTASTTVSGVTSGQTVLGVGIRIEFK